MTSGSSGICFRKPCIFNSLLAKSRSDRIPDCVRALEQSTSSPNYRWFELRYDQFLYIDRIVINPIPPGYLAYGRMFYGII